MQRRSWLRRVPLNRKPMRRKPLKLTGPVLPVRYLVVQRSDGRCEFPACGWEGVCLHHRYERKRGGAGLKSPAAEWINQPENLLVACAYHNDWCSNLHPAEAREIGWLWGSGDPPAADLPVLTCHDGLPVYLNRDGSWTRFEDREQGLR
jgi:hypothetical protein